MSAAAALVAPPVSAPRTRPGWALLTAAAVCAASCLAGVALGVLGAVQTAAGQVTPSTATTSVLDLFVHNAGVLLALAAGLATAGLLTTVLLFYNGVVVGWVVGKGLADGFGHQLLTGLLPHALPELGAYVVSGAASVVLGVDLARHLVTRAERTHGAAAWWRCQGVALVLLAVAAVLERAVSHA